MINWDKEYYNTIGKDGVIGSQGSIGIQGSQGIMGPQGSVGSVIQAKTVHSVTIYCLTDETPLRPIGGGYNFYTDDIDLPDGGWVSDYDDSNGLNVYSSLGTFETYSLDDEYVEPLSWSKPVMESGIKGEDTDEVEHIYIRNNIYEWPDSCIVPESPNQKGYIPDGAYTDKPCGVTKTLKYEWEFNRQLVDDVWSVWNGPNLWSEFGATGTDGDGVQYVYYLTVYADDKPNVSEIFPVDYETNEKYQDDDYVPSGWLDDPVTLDGSEIEGTVYYYQWVAYREKNIESPVNDIKGNLLYNQKKWDKYHKISLWSLYVTEKEPGTQLNILNTFTEKEDFDAYIATIKIVGDDSYIGDHLLVVGDCCVVNGTVYMFVETGEEWQNYGSINFAEQDPSLNVYVHEKYAKNLDTLTASSISERQLCFTDKTKEDDSKTIGESTNGAVYIGTLIDNQPYDSVDPKDYTWKKFLGFDGNGTEYIYTTTKEKEAPFVPTESAFPSSNPISKRNWSGMDSNNVIWTDDPKGIDSDYKYEWVAKRYCVDGVYGNFFGDLEGKAKLYNYYNQSIDGSTGKDGLILYPLGNYDNTFTYKRYAAYALSNNVFMKLTKSFTIIEKLKNEDEWETRKKEIEDNNFEVAGEPLQDGDCFLVNGTAYVFVEDELSWEKVLSTTYEGDEVKPTSETAPYVYYNGQYYYLKNNGEPGSVSGVNPDLSVETGSGIWEVMSSFEAIFADVIMADNGKLGSSVFCGNYILSQQGRTVDWDNTEDYQYFFKSIDPYYEDNTYEYYVNNSCEYIEDGETKYLKPYYEEDEDGNIIYTRNKTFLPNWCVDLLTGKMWCNAGRFKTEGKYGIEITNTDGEKTFYVDEYGTLVIVGSVTRPTFHVASVSDYNKYLILAPLNISTYITYVDEGVMDTFDFHSNTEINMPFNPTSGYTTHLTDQSSQHYHSLGDFNKYYCWYEGPRTKSENVTMVNSYNRTKVYNGDDKCEMYSVATISNVNKFRQINQRVLVIPMSFDIRYIGSNIMLDTDIDIESVELGYIYNADDWDLIEIAQNDNPELWGSGKTDVKEFTIKNFQNNWEDVNWDDGNDRYFTNLEGKKTNILENNYDVVYEIMLPYFDMYGYKIPAETESVSSTETIDGLNIFFYYAAMTYGNENKQQIGHNFRLTPTRKQSLNNSIHFTKVDELLDMVGKTVTFTNNTSRPFIITSSPETAEYYLGTETDADNTEREARFYTAHTYLWNADGTQDTEISHPYFARPLIITNDDDENYCYVKTNHISEESSRYDVAVSGKTISGTCFNGGARLLPEAYSDGYRYPGLTENIIYLKPDEEVTLEFVLCDQSGREESYKYGWRNDNESPERLFYDKDYDYIYLRNNWSMYWKVRDYHNINAEEGSINKAFG